MKCFLCENCHGLGSLQSNRTVTKTQSVRVNWGNSVDSVLPICLYVGAGGKPGLSGFPREHFYLLRHLAAPNALFIIFTSFFKVGESWRQRVTMAQTGSLYYPGCPGTHSVVQCPQ